MRRRALLSGALLAATAGCLGIGRKPVLVRATRAKGDETDVRCRLERSFVAEHPPLERALRRARGGPVLEWSTVGVTVERGHRIADALAAHCEESGGIYVYRNETFFVSISPRADARVTIPHHHTEG